MTMRSLALGLAAAAALAAAAPLHAQALDGFLLDPATRQPVARAAVLLLDSAGRPVGRVETRADGRFRLRAPAAGTYAVRVERGGAVLVTGTVRLAAGETTEVEMQAGGSPSASSAVSAAAGADSAVALAPVEAVAQRRFLSNVGYYDRKSMGFGAFLTGDEFRERGGARTVDAIQGLRGIYAQPTRTNTALSSMSWVLYQHHFGGRCAVSLYIDGILRDAEALQQLRAEDVEAVEAYSGSEVPPRFSRTSGPNGSRCGAIVIWLKHAGG